MTAAALAVAAAALRGFMAGFATALKGALLSWHWRQFDDMRWHPGMVYLYPDVSICMRGGYRVWALIGGWLLAQRCR